MNEDKIELEEAIMYLKKIAKEYKTYGDLDNPEFEDTKKIAKAIETVLQELVKLQKHCKEMIKEKQELTSALLDSIPKKKIEDVKNKYKISYKKHKEVADKQFEEVGTRACFDNELAIRDLGAIRVCEELLEG